jgi:hypothetical protein
MQVQMVMLLELSGLHVALYFTEALSFGLRLNRSKHHADAERSTSVLRSQAIPRQLLKAVLLANLDSYILSEIGE